MSTVYIRFSARVPEERQRAPLLERLVARAAAGIQIADWRIDAMHAVAPSVDAASAVAAAVLCTGAEPSTSSWPWACVASPVHLTAGMSRVSMSADGVLPLAADEAAALTADFNRVFADGTRLTRRHGTHLLCEFASSVIAVTHDPEVVAGRDVFDFQPTGRDAPRLRRLMTEVEMWLFDHAVNRARAARGQPPVIGLWLWGGGRAGDPKPALPIWAAGDDVCFGAFGSESTLPDVACGRARSGVVVCDTHPGGSQWLETERRWLEPCWAALNSGRLERLELSAGEYRVSLRRGIQWRRWRRVLPWWESFRLAV